MKKLLTAILASAMMLTVVGCSSPAESSTASTEQSSTETSTVAPTAGTSITVVTREDGSGTRGAFVELTGILVDDMDNTTVEAIVHDGTGKVKTAVAEAPGSIGYISVGSLDETVTAVNIDGAAPTSENILSGTYKIARPFNIATLEEPTGVAADLIGYILSPEAQAIVEAEGFIPLEGVAYTSTMPEGDLIVGGSTSVTPLMEKLVEEYALVNPNAYITIEGSGSSAGMQGAVDGIYDIGMASRELKDSEKEALAYSMAIAQDGIAVVVNNGSDVTDLTMAQVADIYTGKITDWTEVK